MALSFPQAKIRVLLRVAARQRWLALSVATALFLLGATASSYAPERFEASSRVFVDTDTVLKPLMSGLTFQPDIDQQVRMLARTLLSRENIEKLIAMPELNFKPANARDHEILVGKLMEQIQVVPTLSSNLFDITYRGQDPEVARRLVQAVVDMFVRSGAASRQKDSREAMSFIEQQIGTYEDMLRTSEAKLKEFKMRNFGVSGVPSQDYFTRVSVMTDELARLKNELLAAEKARDAYRRQLNGSPENDQADERATRTAELEQRLQLQRKQLDELLQRYTDDHPDVAGTRKRIAQLEAELKQRRDQDRLLGPQNATATPPVGSPTYQGLRISLAEAESKAEGLRSQVASLQRRLDETRADAGKVPAVEAEFAQLNRDYDIIRHQYDAMVTRRESALLGAKMDERSQLAEFRIIDPARVSSKPVFPGRKHLTAISALAALALGLLVALLREFLQPTVNDVGTLRSLVNRPVIGSVSMVVTPTMLRSQRRSSRRFVAAATTLLTAQMVWVAWMALRPAIG
jgi:polysaccharide chain length determinant protein (PEP-CTERM system associated)